MTETIGSAAPKQKGSPLKRAAINGAVFVCLLLLVSAITTQYLAAAFEYHQALGEPLAGVVYWPWSWASWALSWWSTHTQLMQRAVTIFTAGSTVALVIYAFGIILMSRKAEAIEGLHGTAHWASKKEIQDGGLLPKDKKKPAEGVYVGAWKDDKTGKLNYLRHDGPEHVLAFAPTRSGKGVGLVLPTLLSWKGSVLCYDIKGENWALTAGWRKNYAGNKVMKFDPAATDGSSVAFNPLEEIRIGEDQEVGDAQNVATMLVDPEGKGLVTHWDKTGHALLTGAILHCCYEKQQEDGRCATLADVGALLANPSMTIEQVLEHMLEYPHKGDKPHPLVAQEARAMLNKDERELSSVVSTAISYLTLYRDPIVAKNTSRSDFRIHDLMNDEDPVSLYLVVRPSDAERLRPLIRLMITQIVRRLTEKMDFQDGRSVAHYNHRLLLLIDEFASLKRLSVIEEALAFMAGYGLKAYLIVQDLQQIMGAYGREEGLVGNCHVRIAYAPNKIETAELLSRMSGQTTVIRKQTTVSGKRFGHMLGQVSESMQEVQRPLITADEAMRLPAAVKDANDQIKEPGHMLIFVAGHAPIYGRQILYFRDPTFQARAKVPAPKVSDRTRFPELTHETSEPDFKLA